MMVRKYFRAFSAYLHQILAQTPWKGKKYDVFLSLAKSMVEEKEYQSLILRLNLPF